MSNDTAWVVLEAKDTSSLLDEIERKELEWHQKYGRDKCKFGNQCVHCCPICCCIIEDIKDEEGRLIGFRFKGMRFEPKKEEK